MIYATDPTTLKIQPHERYSQSSPKRLAPSRSNINSKTIFKSNRESPEQSDRSRKIQLDSQQGIGSKWSKDSEKVQLELELERNKKELDFYRKTVEEMTMLISNNHHNCNLSAISFIGSLSGSSEQNNTSRSYVNPRKSELFHRNQEKIDSLKQFRYGEKKTSRSHIPLPVVSVNKTKLKEKSCQKNKQNGHKFKLEVYEKKIRQLDGLVNKLFQYISENSKLQQDDKIKKLQKRNGQLVRQNEQLIKQVQKLCQRNIKLEQNLSEKLKCNQNYQEIVRQAEEQVKNIEGLYKLLVDKKVLDDQETLNLKSKLKEYQQQLNSCKNYQEKQREEESKYIKDLEDAREQLAEIQFTKQQMLARADRDKYKFEQQIETLKEANSAMQLQLDRQQYVISKLQEQLSKNIHTNENHK